MQIDTDNIKTTEEVQEMIKTLQGLTTKKRIRYKGGIPDYKLVFDCDPQKYTFKPKPKFRPWTAEEGLGKKIRWKDNHNNSYLITGYSVDEGFLIRRTADHYYPASVLLASCVQLNGSPCGVKEEG